MNIAITNNDPKSAVVEVHLVPDGGAVIYGDPYLWTRNIHQKNQVVKKNSHLLVFTSQKTSPYLIKNRTMFNCALQLLRERNLVSGAYLQKIYEAKKVLGRDG